MGIVFIVTTLSQEINSVCRVRNHSQFHWSASVLSGGRIQHWMCCWKAELTMIGTSSVGWQLSDPWTGFTQFTTFLEKHPDGCACDRGGGWQKFRQHQGMIFSWPEIWSGTSKAAQREENSIGPLRSRSSTMFEREASISSVQMKGRSEVVWENG